MNFEPEFSRTISIAHIDHGDVVQTIEADALERAAINTRLKLEGVAALKGDFILRRDPHMDLYKVEGEVSADITQLCVSSGEPFDAKVKATIRALFSAEAGLAIDFGDESWDDVEPVTNSQIDIGELAVQHVSLALDPYPRKPGLEFAAGHHVEKSVSPFAMLKGLIGKD
jgi:uncharacterized metal-binding protein YceD (DUF177 family)